MTDDHESPSEDVVLDGNTSDQASGMGDQRPTSLKRKASSTGVRQRTTRACDICHSSRTKCNGQLPCDHCKDTGLTCAYARAQKKRGKAARSEQARTVSQETTSTAPFGTGLERFPSGGSDRAELHRTTSRVYEDPPSLNLAPPFQAHDPSTVSYATSQDAFAHTASFPGHWPANAANDSISATNVWGNLTGLMDDFQMMDPNYYDFSVDQQQMHEMDMAHPMRSLNEAVYTFDFAHGMGQQSFNNFAPQSTNIQNGHVSNHLSADAHSVGSPDAASQHSATDSTAVPPPRITKWPILQSLQPYLRSIKVSPALASDLLEHYFASSFQSTPHPISTYLIGYVFSKRAFLTTKNPRTTSPALLLSMLWLAAQTCNAAALTSSTGARQRISQKLLSLTLKLLNPLLHSSEMATSLSSHVITDTGVKNKEFSTSADHADPGNMAEGTFDDLATYMHLATVVSASEEKGASIRWWNVAWSLAKELKLGHELPKTSPSKTRRQPRNNGDAADEVDSNDDDLSDDDSIPPGVTEQEREERRRLWWLLYVVDRHLALCYNRPLILQDRDCIGLLRPIDEKSWQTGDFDVVHYSSLGIEEARALSSRTRDCPVFEYTGESVFGYWLPLMVILGEIIDLVQILEHPYYGHVFRTSGGLEAQREIIRGHLAQYMGTLDAYRSKHLGVHAKRRPQSTPQAQQDGNNLSQNMSEAQIEICLASAYSLHVSHVLHLLLTGKWDPIQLLDESDWLSTPEFQAATGHAVSGAAAIREIMIYDPELSFMPWFWGIYLLQGSFLLLLVADKWQSNASPAVVAACGVIVRAHEACVVTLNTEYQRNFRKIMQSALAQVHRRLPEESIEQQRRSRRETLALYRWSGKGKGLAI